MRRSGRSGVDVGDPHRVREAWHALGRRLSHWRQEAGLSQKAFGAQVQYSRSSVGSIETGLQHVDRSFWEAADRLLGAGGELVRGYDTAEDLQRAHQHPATSRTLGTQHATDIGHPLAAASPFIASGRGKSAMQATTSAPVDRSNHLAGSSGQEPKVDHYLWAPPGRALPGLAIPAQLHPAVLGEQVMTQVPAAYAHDPFIQRPGRALVVGQMMVRIQQPSCSTVGMPAVAYAARERAPG